MIGSHCGLVGLACVMLPQLHAARPVDKPAVVRALTAAIDREIAADWSAHGVTPAPDADDAEFLRRVYLDVVGRIPRVGETRAFLDDKAPDKRAKLVDRLLATPGHAAHFASLTRADWLPQTNTDPQVMYLGMQFEDWLRKRYAANDPLNEVVRTVLTAKVTPPQRGGAYGTDEFALQAFYQANGLKPENVAATASRAFLGVRLECAQCHDHPFVSAITREHFWQFAAFFAEVAPGLGAGYMLDIPNTKKTVTAAFPDGTAPDWDRDRRPRKELADWLTSGKNPYFARNLANRLWAHFLGTGLVDPVDEHGDAHPPSHPALLDALTAALVESRFDQRVLIRAITASRAYGRTSRLTHPTQADPRRFARAAVRGLTANQIYDSYLSATGRRDRTPGNQFYFDPRDEGRGVFRAQFADPGKPTDPQTSILQALMLMNGKAVADQTSVDRSEILAAAIDAPFFDTTKRVEVVFLAALTRMPTPEETERYASYVDRGGATGDRGKALADVFWVLLNSAEFVFNH